MLKKIISFLIVFSLLYTDLAYAMKDAKPSPQDDFHISLSKRSPIEIKHRRTKSEPSFSDAEGDLQGSPHSKASQKEETSSNDVHKGSPTSSIKATPEKPGSDQDRSLSSDENIFVLESRSRSSSEGNNLQATPEEQMKFLLSHLPQITTLEETEDYAPRAQSSTKPLESQDEPCNIAQEVKAIRKEINQILEDALKLKGQVAATSILDDIFIAAIEEALSKEKSQPSKTVVIPSSQEQLAPAKPEKEEALLPSSETSQKEGSGIEALFQDLKKAPSSQLNSSLSQDVSSVQNGGIKKGKKKEEKSKKKEDERTQLLSPRPRSSYTEPQQRGSIQASPDEETEEGFVIINGSLREFFDNGGRKRASLSEFVKKAADSTKSAVGSAKDNLRSLLNSLGSSSQRTSSKEEAASEEERRENEPLLKDASKSTRDQDGKGERQSKLEGERAHQVADKSSAPPGQRNSRVIEEAEPDQQDKGAPIKEPHGEDESLLVEETKPRKQKALTFDIFAEGDLEEGQKSAILIFTELTEAGKQKLAHLKRTLIDGYETCGEIAAKISGIIIGLGVCYFMGPVFNGSLDFLKDTYKWPWLVNYIQSGSFFEDPALYYFPLTLSFDSIPRNVSFWKEFVADLRNGEVSKARALWTSIFSFLPSFTEPVYLILFELYAMNIAGVEGFNNGFALTAVIGCPFLFIDSWASNYTTLFEFERDIETWSRTSSLPLAHHLKRLFPPPSEKNILQDTFHTQLDQTCKYLFFLDEDDKTLDTIYDNIFNSRDKILPELSKQTEKEVNLSVSELDSLEKFLVIRYLLSLSKEEVENQKSLNRWYAKITDWINYGCLAVGSPMRLLVLELIFETCWGLITPKGASQVLGWFFAVIGFPFQTALEYKGINRFFRDFLQDEDPHSYTSHTWARVVSKVVCGVQGSGLASVLMGVLILQAWLTWFKPETWPVMVVTGIPFFFGELTTQINQFNGTYNKKDVSKFAEIHNLKTRKCFGKEPTRAFKRDRLVQLTKDVQGQLISLPLDVLRKLSEISNQE